ncbi:MAG: methionine biosynthesis protein MetW [Pseudomonadota bacterium]
MKPEFAAISSWIHAKSRVLDLGCGDGELLKHLSDLHNINAYGLEINHAAIVNCVHKGLNVIQSDLDEGWSEFFASESFDFVVMTQTLQAIKDPEKLLNEMLRVGRQGIVTFPNLGFWTGRLQFLLKGRMPVTRVLPYQWYNTPNIHLCTFNDFESLCARMNIYIHQRTVVDYAHKSNLLMKILPNFFGEVAIYRFSRNKKQ